MKINPCPFCKTSDHVSCIPVGCNVPPHGPPHQVRCISIMCDDVKGPAKYGAFEAIRAWNEASHNPEVEKLKLALTKIQQIKLACVELDDATFSYAALTYVHCLNDMIDEIVGITDAALKESQHGT